MGEIEGKMEELVITLRTGNPNSLSGIHWKAWWAFLKAAVENGRGF